MNAAENRQLETELEQRRLRETIALAQEQLEQAEKSAKEKEEGILEAKREVRENATHSLTNLYSSDGFEALVELSQCIDPVTEILADYEDEMRKIARLEKLIRKPYFARIDFRFDGEEEAERVYIGRSSLIEKQSRERYVYDWRSPIASVFYRFMTGAAFYDAPAGKIGGEVELKRQYEIQNGALEYFFDTDRNISDELLRQMLSKNTSPQMKAIVETIQKEQDIVIRDMGSDLLMVQGVAGSGKTSIALHRAAYLMYQGLQSRLAANSILIVSPNAAFEEYIANVLPELGEENVESLVFDEVLEAVLKGVRIQPKHEFLEHAVTNDCYREIVKKSMEFKTSKQFLTRLNQALSGLPLQTEPQEAENYDLIGRYKAIFYDRAYQAECEMLPEFGELVPEIWKYTQENLDSGRLYYDDAIAVAYLYLKLIGNSPYRNIRQVVIDEAQDYYYLQYEMFRLLFPGAKFTVLGDINQTLAKQADLSLYEQVGKILNKKKAALITLDKSFRCTNEILEFSLQFVEHRPEIQSFNRQGDRPAVTAADTHRALLESICQEVKTCREKGLRSICLLCKTEKNAAALFEELKAELDLQMIRDQAEDGLQGTFIMPVYLSKGLEFDAVLLCDVDAETYYDEDDRKLLYVECTRALHRLNLFCEGECSPLLNQGHL